MSRTKRKIASVLVFVFSLFSIISYLPGQASAKTSPKVQAVISGVAYKYSAGDKAVMKLTSSTTSTVQYRVFVKNSYEKTPVDITKGYTKAVKGKSPFAIALPTSKVGVNTVTVYVKKAGSKAKYDSYKRVIYSVVKVQATVSGIVPKYNLGDKATVRLAAVNAGTSTVQYRLFVKNSNEKTPVEVTKGYTKLVKPNAPYAITLPTSKEGLNTVTVYVRRAGGKAIYDNYRRIQYTVVKEVAVETPVVLDKEGITYGSSDANKPLDVNNDVYVSANNITLNNLKVNGTIYINPGKDGNADLNNVSATNIVVQSGGQNSVHFNGVKVEKALTVSAKDAVRIETKGTTVIASTIVKSSTILDATEGSFGDIEIIGSNSESQTVELRGAFNNTIKVEGQVILKAADSAKFAKIDVTSTDPNATVRFEGASFTNVEVNSTAKIVIPAGVKVTLTVNVKNANIEVAKGAVVNIDAKNNPINLTGDGKNNSTVTNPYNPPTSGGGGGSISIPDNNAKFNSHINLLVSAIGSNTTLNDDINVDPIAYPGSTQNPTINVKISNKYNTYKYQDMITAVINKLSSRSDNSDIAGLVTKALASDKVKVGTLTLREYVVEKIGDTTNLQTIKTILQKQTITNEDITTLINLLKNNDSLAKIQEILASIGGDITITNPVVIDGLTLSSVKIGSTTIYSTDKKIIKVGDIRTALGLTDTAVDNVTVGKFFGKTVTAIFTDAEGTYTYTFNLTGF